MSFGGRVRTDVPRVPAVGSQRKGEPGPAPRPGTAGGLLTRPAMLLRLVRLDVVVIDRSEEPWLVRAANGATSPVHRGWWPVEEVQTLVAELGLSYVAFEEMR
jgi:hypothetical protein